tara:strand:+ start:70 stop:522 length:453 start_codon:yes stop_codon:yes gene_type:complete
MASLTKRIEEAFKKSSGFYDLPEEERDEARIPDLAKDLADAIVEWIQAQRFQITDMKAVLEVENMSTTAPTQADALPSISVIAGSPPGPGNVINGTKGVLVPPVDFSKRGGKGGILTAQGHAYIGRKNPINPNKGLEDDTTVKLLEVKDK